MLDMVDRYLEAKESAWAESTWRSEKSRLKALGARINDAPAVLHKKLKEEGKKPYSIKTLFIRLSDMQAWAGVENTYGQYLQTHKNRFKHVYQKEEVTVSYEEAKARIEGLEAPYREMALGLLLTGVRISESYKVKDGKVEGKGGKVRKVYGEIKATCPKSTFAAKLKEIGLKPHTLRKLRATVLAEKGASAADLCKIFGWSDIKTAYQYLQAKEESKLQELMK